MYKCGALITVDGEHWKILRNRQTYDLCETCANENGYKPCEADEFDILTCSTELPNNCYPKKVK